jgi:hypothetical protein
MQSKEKDGAFNPHRKFKAWLQFFYEKNCPCCQADGAISLRQAAAKQGL